MTEHSQGAPVSNRSPAHRVMGLPTSPKTGNPTGPVTT